VKEKILKLLVLTLAFSALCGYVYYSHQKAQPQTLAAAENPALLLSPSPPQAEKWPELEALKIWDDGPIQMIEFENFINYGELVAPHTEHSSSHLNTLILSSKNISAPVFEIRVGPFLNKARYQAFPRSAHEVLNLFQYKSHLSVPKNKSPSP
jgi:hypothetical protein